LEADEAKCVQSANLIILAHDRDELTQELPFAVAGVSHNTSHIDAANKP
jgi:hypothetical protein